MKICAHKNNSSFCKECKKEYDRMNYINNRDEFLKRQKKYYEDNKEYILEYQKNYVKENEEKIASRRKKHYEDNKIVYSDRTKKQREKNRLNNIINGTILDKKIVPQAENHQQKLSDDQIIEVARLVIDVRRIFNTEVDVEWTIENGKIFILQSRPITTVQ